MSSSGLLGYPTTQHTQGWARDRGLSGWVNVMVHMSIAMSRVPMPQTPSLPQAQARGNGKPSPSPRIAVDGVCGKYATTSSSRMHTAGDYFLTETPYQN